LLRQLGPKLGVGALLLQAVESINAYREAVGLLRADEIVSCGRLLADVHRRGRWVYVFGNGGSASTASHLAVDLGKNTVNGPGPRIRVMSLADNSAWLTAVSNDRDYADCFVEPLRNYLDADDVVIGISASGNSENMVRAFEYARSVGARSIALVGFDGGKLATLADQRVWVDSHDYGVVESLHLMVAHMWVRMLTVDQPSVANGTCEGLRRGDLSSAVTQPAYRAR